MKTLQERLEEQKERLEKEVARRAEAAAAAAKIRKNSASTTGAETPAAATPAASSTSSKGEKKLPSFKRKDSLKKPQHAVSAEVPATTPSPTREELMAQNRESSDDQLNEIFAAS